MSKQRGLGRGLDSLIPTEVTADMPVAVQPAGEDVIQYVNPDAVVPNPHQPRTHFDADELQGLANSIKQHGLLHPPVVSDLGDGRFELIAGERRTRAAKVAGLDRMPVIVRSFDEQQKLELALLENVQRSELNPIETAVAYRKLADEFNLTLDEIGTRMGKAKSTVANSMRLLSLPAEALDAVANGTISEAHGRTLLSLDTAEEQLNLLHQIANEHLSVRQAEAIVRGEKTPEKTSEKTSSDRSSVASEKTVAPTAQTQSAYAEVAQDLADHFVTRVSISAHENGGEIIISYKSDEELRRLIHEIYPAEPSW